MVASKKIYEHTPEEGPNSLNHGHSLLSFMNSASNKVKTALEKPNSFKRNINHRRFLQKQFRAMVKSPEKTAGRKSFTRDHIDSMNFTLRECNNATYPPPLHHNFVQFDALQSSIPNLGIAETNSCTRFARSENYGKEHYAKRQIQGNIFENGLVGRQGSSCLYQNVSSTASVPDLVQVEEDFLTCEELTQAIELKDLFIPETDLTQYLLNGKENLDDFYSNSDAALGFDNWQCRESFGLQEDILVF